MRAFFRSLGILKIAILTTIVVSLFNAPASGAPITAAVSDEAAIKATLTKLLRENPDLVLNILRDHSEDVLEIAQQGNMQRKRKSLLSQWEEDAKAVKKVNIEGHAIRGPQNAPVTIIAYSDFTCPFCRNAEQIISQLLPKYKNKVRFVFKPLPKEGVAISLAAARYSTAAFMQDNAKGWQFYELIFAGMENLEQDGENFLKATAVKAGLDLKRLMTDAANPKVQAMIDADRAEADSMQVPGTPYFLVNNLVVRGALPKELFEDAIETALNIKK